MECCFLQKNTTKIKLPDENGFWGPLSTNLVRYLQFIPNKQNESMNET